jgi:peptide/nickel transport system substrate-binding protein
MTQLSRRAFGGLAAAFAFGLALPAQGRARTPEGGTLALHVPWSTASLDPHELADPLAALFGPAVFDPLFALDAAGTPYAALADGMPTAQGGRTTVRLREGLRTARGLALDGRDVVASVQRARARGAAAWLASVPVPVVHPKEPHLVSFEGIAPDVLARSLASPLVALVPRGFSPTEPDGTGAFAATLEPASLRLVRNPKAARGAAFLQGLTVARADDLRASLRAFEARQDDVGWLGAGLHEARNGATRFDLGAVAHVVLLASAGVSAGNTPGALQTLCDGLPGERLRHLGLGALPSGSGVAWSAAPIELLVDEAAPHLVEIADALASLLSLPGHELSVRRAPRAEVLRVRASTRPALALTVVGRFDPSLLGAFIALATADDPARARELVLHPPRIAPSASAATLARTLRLGVLGELRVTGAVSEDFVLRPLVAGGWDLGASHATPKRARP